MEFWNPGHFIVSLIQIYIPISYIVYMSEKEQKRKKKRNKEKRENGNETN